MGPFPEFPSQISWSRGWRFWHSLCSRRWHQALPDRSKPLNFNNRSLCCLPGDTCGVRCSLFRPFLGRLLYWVWLLLIKVREADLFERRSWKKSPSVVIRPEGSRWTCQNKYICINYPQYESQGWAQSVAHSAACWECCMAEAGGPKEYYLIWRRVVCCAPEWSLCLLSPCTREVLGCASWVRLNGCLFSNSWIDKGQRVWA